MPHDGLAPGSVQDWLRYARSDLAFAVQPMPDGVLLEMLCFHAQQAVEKSIKAVLLHNGINFPYTHNIARLITLLVDEGISWPSELDPASRLTDYAVVTRYPGSVDVVSDAEYRATVAVAQKVLCWAEQMVADRVDA